MSEDMRKKPLVILADGTEIFFDSFSAGGSDAGLLNEFWLLEKCPDGLMNRAKYKFVSIESVDPS